MNATHSVYGAFFYAGLTLKRSSQPHHPNELANWKTAVAYASATLPLMKCDSVFWDHIRCMSKRLSNRRLGGGLALFSRCAGHETATSSHAKAASGCVVCNVTHRRADMPRPCCKNTPNN